MRPHIEDSPNDHPNNGERLNNSNAELEPLVSVTPDVITISAIKINYSRENLNKVLDFINDITEGATKL